MTNQRSEIDITIGKPIDMLAFKGGVLRDFVSWVRNAKSGCALLYKTAKTIKACPICGASAKNSRFQLSVYGAHYHQCLNCSHCFVINRPAESVLRKFYANDNCNTSLYVDRKLAKVRVEQVNIPKAKWIIKQFKRFYGEKPKSILDVGAGGGHFVYACKKLGVDAQGIEMNRTSRKFCREHFGFNLRDDDFMKIKSIDADVVTFWGVIEHASDPNALLKKARSILRKKNILVVAEVPHWDSLSTIIQHKTTNSIIRHLNPIGHINCFTENSLCMAFEISGLVPAAKWYYGMDAYELFTQLSYLSNTRPDMDKMKECMPLVQAIVDKALYSDTLVLAGVSK